MVHFSASNRNVFGIYHFLNNVFHSPLIKRVNSEIDVELASFSCQISGPCQQSYVIQYADLELPF